MTRPPRMRPRFRIPIAGDGQQVLGRIREQLASSEAEYVGQVLGDHGCVRLPENRRSILSPHLETRQDCRVDGRDPAEAAAHAVAAYFFRARRSGSDTVR